MKEIRLTRGMVALVDDVDYPHLSLTRWYAQQIGVNWYAVCRLGSGAKPRSSLIATMHMVLMGRRKGFQIDHRDRNGLNNQRGNLRWATASDNLCNRQSRGSSTGFRGVSFQGGRYVAQIGKNRRVTYLGRFSTAEEAARAYNHAARLVHGEFAWLNKVSEEVSSAV